MENQSIGIPLTLIDLAGAAALLLWGVHMVQTGVQRAFGARLRVFLASTLASRAPAFLAGIGVTALLQSSTATGLMVAGFAADGLVDLVPALAAMLGANVGTTIIVQLVSFHVGAVAPGLILVGVVMFRRAQAGLRDFGRVLIGLGLLLMALGQFIALLTPYEDVPSLRLLLGSISDQPVIDVAAGALFAWAAHSSVAIVLVAMGFAAQGTVSPDAALALVLGANLGTAINPVLEGGRAGDPSTRRLPLGNLLNRVIGIVIVLPLIGPIGRLVVTFEPNASRAIADFHTAFNLCVAVLFFPFLGPFAALLRRLMPARANQADPGLPLYLDRAAASETPIVALGHAAREALRLADFLGTMLDGLADGIAHGVRTRIADARRLDHVVERLDREIKQYVTGLDPEAMSEADENRAEAILAFGINIELAAGILDRNLLAMVARKTRLGLRFAPAGQAELEHMIALLATNIRVAASVFTTGDRDAADALLAEKTRFRTLERSAIEAHFARLRARKADSIETSGLHLEMLSDLRRVNTFLVAAAAYKILDRDTVIAEQTGDAEDDRNPTAPMKAQIT